MCFIVVAFDAVCVFLRRPQPSMLFGGRTDYDVHKIRTWNVYVEQYRIMLGAKKFHVACRQ